jgi:uncharacterized tellurite resistance protein B-like protein
MKKEETMLKDFTREERKALVAIIKYMVAADGEISENEIEECQSIAATKGFEDYTELFSEVDREMDSVEDILALLPAVSDRNHEEDILRIALEIARLDTSVAPEEVEVLSILANAWNIDIQPILDDLQD